jgi:small-conductance mechanosensitive channel
MESFFNVNLVMQKFNEFKDWASVNILVWDNFVQIATQIIALLAARLIGTIVGRWFRNYIKPRIQGKTSNFPYLTNFISRLLELVPLIASVLVLALFIEIVGQIDHNTWLMRLVLNLSVAWVVIQLATSVILDQFWSRLIAMVIWALAALNISGILDETMAVLGGIGFSLGGVKVTLLSIVKAVVIIMVLLKAVSWFSAYLERKLATVSEILPSTRLIITKSLNIALLFLVGLIAMHSVGINLTALTFFSGAIGLGVGFGLQKVVSNFISGLILLSDKSIKPGDVIQLADVYGVVKNMGGRCVSVITRDEKEHLIPNENLFTQEVINWSYSTQNLRIHVPVGISYQDDPHTAIRLIVDKVKGIRRILTSPPPICLLRGFGESSVDLELRFWINDPQNGVANITSVALLAVWDALKENDIEIPFPQRDVHLDVDSARRMMEAAREEG